LRLGNLAIGHRMDSRSRMTGDCHIRLLESAGGETPLCYLPESKVFEALKNLGYLIFQG
jgi:hypothetical protein